MFNESDIILITNKKDTQVYKVLNVEVHTNKSLTTTVTLLKLSLTGRERRDPNFMY